MQKKIQRLEENLIVLQNIYAQHNFEKLRLIRWFNGQSATVLWNLFRLL